MEKLLKVIKREQASLRITEIAAKWTTSKEERRRLCREMHQTEQLLAALEKRLDAVVKSNQ